ncbi:MAG: hypothetical protein J5502_11080 [Prevotella sp.]|nr:hypothetical protein [Prevotella sp.]
MKRAITTIAAVVFSTMMMANPVNPAAARQAAARFLQEKGVKLKNQAMQAPRRAMHSRVRRICDCHKVS